MAWVEEDVDNDEVARNRVEVANLTYEERTREKRSKIFKRVLDLNKRTKTALVDSR